MIRVGGPCRHVEHRPLYIRQEVMANITSIVLTVQTETEQLTTSGYLLASECVGAVAGLLLFRSFGLAHLRVAYQLTAVSMIAGNGLYAWASIQSKGLPALFVSRMITGVGAGSMLLV